jgi:hypothetical protein
MSSGKFAKIKINKFGDTKIEMEGFTGTSCMEASQAIEIALGGGGKRNLKPEYDEPESTEQSAEQALRF